MANTHSTLSSLFAAIANAIRNKTGSTDVIAADNFPTAIEAIKSGGITADSPFVANAATSSSSTRSTVSITIDTSKKYIITTAFYYEYSGGCGTVSNWIYENGTITPICGSKGTYGYTGYQTIGFSKETNENGYGTLTISGSTLTYKNSDSFTGISANGVTIIAVEM